MTRSTILASLSLSLAMLAGTANAADAAGKKVLLIHAYHQGYAWTDGEDKGLHTVLDATKADVKTFYMDTKNNPAKEFAQQKGEEAKKLIDEWKPDAVVVTDDNPVKWVLKPFFKDAATPFVFCGVNFDGKAHGLPYANTAGMYEVSLDAQCVESLAKFAKGKRVTWLAADVESSRADGAHITVDLAAKGYTLTETYVTDWAGWKTAFTAAQGTSDILLMHTAGVKGWPKDEAVAFHEAETKIPTGCLQVEITPYVLAGFCKIAEEQGEWAGNAVVQILGGKKPSEVGEANNKKAKLVLNMRLAKKLGVMFDLNMVKQAELIK